MDRKRRRKQVNSSKENSKLYFIAITLGLFSRVLLVAAEPVCYTRKVLDPRTTVVSRTECNADPEKIYIRFNSPRDVEWNRLLTIMCSGEDLPKVPHGSFICSGYSVGDKCNLTCDDGFYSNSPKKSICKEGNDAEGNWTNGDFMCSAIICSEENLPNVPHGSFNCSGYSVGDKCNLICNDGFYPNSSKGSICEEDNDSVGHWTSGDFECSAIMCSGEGLPNVLHGSFNCSGYSVGDQCNLTCDDGFYPNSSQKTICEEDKETKGHWTSGDFMCSAITCSTALLPDVKGGHFDCYDPDRPEHDSDVPFEEPCNVVCNVGFYLTSSNHGYVVCKADIAGQGGKWSEWDEKHECRALNCSEWNEWRGSHYKSIDTRRSWESSNSMCQQEHTHSHLVYIEDQEENDFVVYVLKSCNGSSSWLGMTYHQEEGIWKWGNVHATFYNWGRYNGKIDSGGPSQSVAMISHGSGQWHSQGLNGLHHPFCELDTNS